MNSNAFFLRPSLSPSTFLCTHDVTISNVTQIRLKLRLLYFGKEISGKSLTTLLFSKKLNDIRQIFNKTTLFAFISKNTVELTK
ncbi:Chaperone protein FimB/FhaD [Trichinella pseudospiralis]